MTAPKQTLLIVEDDIDIADMLSAYFRVQGYDVITAGWGEDALKCCQETPPDLLILDIRLPDIDGFEVANRLRAARRTREIPIIFLTEKRERKDRLHGLELQAEDYITKPFDIQELRLRVRNALRRNAQGPLTNTVTGLADGNLVDERLRECLEGGGWGILTVSLDHLDLFREVYGFVACDDLLRALALMLQDTLRESGLPTDFLGHLTPASFILVVQSGSLDSIREAVRKKLSVALNYFYRDQDRAAAIFKGQELSLCLADVRAADTDFTDLDAFRHHLYKLAKPDA